MHLPHADKLNSLLTYIPPTTQKYPILTYIPYNSKQINEKTQIFIYYQNAIQRLLLTFIVSFIVSL